MKTEIVCSTVSALYPHGTVVVVNGRKILVHLWEQSWYWPFHAGRHFRIGETRPVWIGDVHRNGHTFPIASFRLVRPDLDPRLKYAVGDVVVGTVRASDAAGVSVELGPDQFADFRVIDVMREGMFAHDFSAGDPFEARVAVMNERAVIMEVWNGRSVSDTSSRRQTLNLSDTSSE